MYYQSEAFSGLGCNCTAGLGVDAPPAEAGAGGTSTTTWVTGGLIFGLAAFFFWAETKGPAPLRRRA